MANVLSPTPASQEDDESIKGKFYPEVPPLTSGKAGKGNGSVTGDTKKINVNPIVKTTPGK